MKAARAKLSEVIATTFVFCSDKGRSCEHIRDGIFDSIGLWSEAAEEVHDRSATLPGDAAIGQW